ncbi:MAG: hypothetical protein NC342_01305 [Pseudoflavonifractor sp.]|nr:hypothetical protein [Pseudoflavonifractor sp.]
MKSFQYIYKCVMPWAMALGMAACTGASAEDEPLPLPQPAPESCRIVVAGSAGSGSRGANEPAITGKCRADRLLPILYSATGGHLNPVGSPPDASALDHALTAEAIDISTKYTGIGNRDKWGAWTPSLGMTAFYHTSFAATALAYNEADRDKFEIGPMKYTTTTLSISGDETPELYFGRLTLNHNELGERSDMVFSDYVSSAHTYDAPASGRLYRIVSQLNLNVTKIPASVDKMEMTLSNLPTSITLFGSHGAFYPVEAAKEDAHRDDVVVATVEHPGAETALSTFILPSDLGRTISVKITYTTGETETFPVRPAKSAFLAANDSEANVYTAAKNADGTLTIYDAVSFAFFSYSNVRVNLSGTFEHVFSETSEADIALEVCPAFERVHDITIN